MAIGIALGYKVAAWIAWPGLLPLHNPALPDRVPWVAPVMAPACSVILLRGTRRDAPGAMHPRSFSPASRRHSALPSSASRS